MVTEGIILAAGFSSRTGTNKMLLKIQNKTVIEFCLEAFYDSCSKIYVIGGWRIDEIRPLITDKKICLVNNMNFSEGMFSSVIAGIRCIVGDRFFITPGDYPIIQKETIQSMLEINESIIIPQFKGLTGHPALISSHLIPEILTGNFKSLKEFINTKKPKYLDVNDIGVISDIDYIEDYYNILNIISKQLH